MDTTFDNQSLTEYEVIGLKTAYDFANGHAHHDMPAALHPVMNDLQGIWAEARGTPVFEMEERFKYAFAGIIESPALAGHAHYSLFPTASNSIDATAAWLKAKGYKAGLIEPVFDNLYLLLRRRQVPLAAVQESDFLDPAALAQKISDCGIDALFLVSPNNPTGFQLSASEFRAVCETCAAAGVILILDATFGFYSRNGYDEYAIIHETGIDFIVIEDTGKTWPTQELKVSLMAYSAPIAREMRVIYEEVYLSHSNFTVALLCRLIGHTQKEGLDKVIWAEVDKRRNSLAQALAGTGVVIEDHSRAVPLPLAWMNCAATGMCDVELIEKLKGSNIALLPGRFFYWATPDKYTTHVRVSLLRSNSMFAQGLAALGRAMREAAG